jgi:hypothetical protein
MMVGFVLLIVPSIWVLVRWYFAAQAAVLDGLSSRRALDRSAALVAVRWWETAGALLASTLVLGLVRALAQAIAHAVHLPVVYVTLVTVIQAVALSLSALFGTLLFFTLRAEREVPLTVA